MIGTLKNLVSIFNIFRRGEDMEDHAMGNDTATEANTAEVDITEENDSSTNTVPKVSIITPAKNEGSNVKMTVDSIIGASSADIPFEVIVVDDNSQDGCCSFLLQNTEYWQESGVKLLRTTGIGAANARNLGARHATGDILVFCDAHVLVEKEWMDKMVAVLSQAGVDVLTPGIADYSNPLRVGFGQTWTEKLETNWLPAPKEVSPIPLAPGGLEAVKREVFESVGGFETGFKIWGYEDVELSLKCWLFGFKVYVTPEVTVKHIFRKRHTYFVSYKEVYYNLIRMALSHFKRERVVKAINMTKSMPQAEDILTNIILSNAWEQRREYFNKRKYDDDWFMNKFQIPF